MNKAAIVTLYGNYNYGNKYQNYAVQEIIRSYGYDVDTLVFYYSLYKEFGRAVKRIIKSITGDGEIKKTRRFTQFSNYNLKVRYVYARKHKFSHKLKNEYDFFFVGSDQVWNPEIRKDERDTFFLKFADDSQKICVSPSIGVSRIQKKHEEIYKDGLKGFKLLSCREASGAAEISRITGKECEHLIDPTLVLSAEKWRSIEKKSDKYGKKQYILCFFLDEFSDVLKEIIIDYADKMGWSLIIASDSCSPFINADPCEMLALIDNAAMIFTDSFHFSAFSINFNTPFWVFDRCAKDAVLNHMSSRIKSLVETFCLTNRYVEVNDLIIDSACDFTQANQILKNERIKFDDYMKKAIKMK